MDQVGAGAFCWMMPGMEVYTARETVAVEGYLVPAHGEAVAVLYGGRLRGAAPKPATGEEGGHPCDRPYRLNIKRRPDVAARVRVRDEQ
jgi:hypothetical protein